MPRNALSKTPHKYSFLNLPLFSKNSRDKQTVPYRAFPLLSIRTSGLLSGANHGNVVHIGISPASLVGRVSLSLPTDVRSNAVPKAPSSHCW